MKIKDFFKLTKFRIVMLIIIFLILEIILYNVFLQYYSQFVYCLAIGCPTRHTETYKMMWNLLIPTGMVSYLLACLTGFLLKK